MEAIFESYLLVTDMDGTLLDKDKEISRENREAIERFVRLGGRFTIATGRIVEPAGYYARQLPVNAPAILYNGAMIYDYGNERPVHQTTLPQAGAAALQSVLDAFPEIGAEIYVQGEPYPYTIRDNAMTARHRSIERFPLQAVQEVSDIPSDWLKILFAWEPEQLDLASESMVRLTSGKGIEWVRSDDRYFEMLPLGATKGDALEHLLALTGLEQRKCVAMGDHLNDLEMIRRAGVGVAVGNAHPLLLEAADHVCKHHTEHAVADVIGWLEDRIRAERS
ncbi:Cof-type HAD-IIB family hydrolase [Paenibacillus puerhi]|uniref:Cof-type HAD-IIB family hydrolase n=1 Tax=Paenibacillus puerhi TaxID=2692622 RepID=UPI0013567FFE|nr:Cof-type HAD-IIB family hydrolase [Paenibacillus puerhi]